MIVFGHALWGIFVNVDSLEVGKISGSLKSIAVALTVLGIRKVPGIDDENTANIVAPTIPDERKVTSAARAGFCNKF